jgi:hypothetical protein
LECIPIQYTRQGFVYRKKAKNLAEADRLRDAITGPKLKKS